MSFEELRMDDTNAMKNLMLPNCEDQCNDFSGCCLCFGDPQLYDDNYVSQIREFYDCCRILIEP